MRIQYPEYYRKFSCIAQNCPDTCCNEWQIPVDDSTFDYYRSADPKIDDSFVHAKDGYYISNHHTYCPFFNEDMLCGLYKKFGEEHMPYICRVYPRFFLDYGGTREIALSPSCPEAARLLLDETEPIRLVGETNDDPPVLNNIDGELYYYLVKSRTAALNIIQNRAVDIKTRINRLLSFGLKLQDNIDSHSYCEISAEDDNAIFRFDPVKAWALLKTTEKLTERWKVIAAEVPLPGEINEIKAENILVYFILHYFLTAVYDGKIMNKIRFAVISLMIVRYADGAICDTADTLHLYCREIIHSDRNVAILQKKSRLILIPGKQIV